MHVRFVPKLLLLIFGLCILAFGVALSIRSNLGTSPISSVPYAYSYIFPFSVGTLTVLMHIIMIVLQMAILGKNFRMLQWLQLPVGIAFGFFIDIALWLTQAWQIEHYFLQLLFCMLSCIITAVGVCIVIRANLIMLAAEGLYLAIATRFHKEFGLCKTVGDIILVIIAASSAYLYIGEVIGIREGTMITAVLVGGLVRKLLPFFHFLDFTQTATSKS